MPKLTHSPLALIDPDAEGGYNVRDTRSGRHLAWRNTIREAAAVQAWLNATYPRAPWPAYDTLVWEIAMERITGRL